MGDSGGKNWHKNLKPLLMEPNHTGLQILCEVLGSREGSKIFKCNRQKKRGRFQKREERRTDVLLFPLKMYQIDFWKKFEISQNIEKLQFIFCEDPKREKHHYLNTVVVTIQSGYRHRHQCFWKYNNKRGLTNKLRSREKKEATFCIYRVWIGHIVLLN